MCFSLWFMFMFFFIDIFKFVSYVEKIGWDGVWLVDYFMFDVVDISLLWFEVWIIFVVFVGVVFRIRMGILVIGNIYCYLVVFVKMVVIIDYIFGGCVVLGLGLGW